MIDTTVAGIFVKMKIDSGSCMNTVADSIWPTLKQAHSAGKAALFNLRTEADTPLLAYGKQKLEVVAQFEAELATVGLGSNLFRIPRIETITVCRGTTTSLMSRQTAEYFKVLKVGPLELNSVDKTKHFPMVPDFVVSFDIDETWPGSVDLALRIPLGQKQEQMRILAEYEEQDIIERVPSNEYPKFVSAQFFVKKSNGSLRLVNDNKEVNKAIRIVSHSMPTLEGFLPELAGSDTFSLFDVTNAFLHLPLDKKAKEITTFNTPIGLCRYKRLNFGINTSPTIFQRYMDSHFKDLPGVLVFMDDICVFGKGHDECLARTEAVTIRLAELNLTLNKDKCKFCQPEVVFLGMRLNSSGIHPTYNKLEALRKMRPPTKPSELRGFLGLFNFFHSFIPNHTDKTKSMRTLLKSGVEFKWTEEMQAEFDYARTTIEENATRAHFDQKAVETIIYTDASQSSLGAMMTQKEFVDSKERMIMCASRATTPAESNYGQDGLEAAAVAWILPKWDYFTLARKITLFTDASALLYIFDRGTRDKRVSNRAKAYALKLSAYDFVVKHITGKDNPADAFSRLSIEQDSAWEPVAELFDIQAADQSWKKSISIDDVRERTRMCGELTRVLDALQSGIWDVSVIKYRPFENELANIGGLLARGSRIVPPVSMRQELLDDAHELHPGIVTMKRFLRQRAWWPGMDADVTNLVKTCYPCLINSPQLPPTPMQITYAPDRPWECIAIDLHSHQPTKAYELLTPFERMCNATSGKKRNLLVIIDLYSRFIRAFPTDRTDAEAITALLALTFSFYGNPDRIKSDNGPPFNSLAYDRFLKDRGILPMHSTPLYPQHNANVERAMGTINNRLRKAAIEDTEFEEIIRDFNKRYNEWPHSQTNVPPFTMMFRRDPRLALPTIVEADPIDEQAIDLEQRLKMERKIKTDAKKRAQESKIKKGDLIVMLAENADKKKISPTYADEIWRVIERIGCEVLCQDIENPLRTRRRNVNCCKVVPNEAFRQDVPEQQVNSNDQDATRLQPQQTPPRQIQPNEELETRIPVEIEVETTQRPPAPAEPRMYGDKQLRPTTKRRNRLIEEDAVEEAT